VKRVIILLSVITVLLSVSALTQVPGIINYQGRVVDAGTNFDGTGQFKYVAGLDPTNSASVFVLKIANVAGQPSQKNLIFNPEVSGRTYTPQFRTNLVTGSWVTPTGIGGPTTNIDQVTITDLNAVEPQKFYRVDISLP